MPLYLGIPFTILILVVASQARIGNITLEWVAAALAGLWSAMQSRKYMLQRFERVFPLEPLALGITVTLLFPCTDTELLDERRVDEVATIVGGVAAPLTVTFNAASTPAAAHAILRNAFFQTSSGSTLDRTLQLVATDGDGGSATVNKSLVFQV